MDQLRKIGMNRAWELVVGLPLRARLKLLVTGRLAVAVQLRRTRDGTRPRVVGVKV